MHGATSMAVTAPRSTSIGTEALSSHAEPEQGREPRKHRLAGGVTGHPAAGRGVGPGSDEVDVSLDGLDHVVEVAVERLLGEAQREPLRLAKRDVRREAQRDRV